MQEAAEAKECSSLKMSVAIQVKKSSGAASLPCDEKDRRIEKKEDE